MEDDAEDDAASDVTRASMASLATNDTGSTEKSDVAAVVAAGRRRGSVREKIWVASGVCPLKKYIWVGGVCPY